MAEDAALDAYLAERSIQFSKRGERYQQFKYGPHVVDLFLLTIDN